jgi:hypothetical protein
VSCLEGPVLLQQQMHAAVLQLLYTGQGLHLQCASQMLRKCMVRITTPAKATSWGNPGPALAVLRLDCAAAAIAVVNPGTAVQHCVVCICFTHAAPCIGQFANTAWTASQTWRGSWQSTVGPRDNARWRQHTSDVVCEFSSCCTSASYASPTRFLSALFGTPRVACTMCIWSCC